MFRIIDERMEIQNFCLVNPPPYHVLFIQASKGIFKCSHYKGIFCANAGTFRFLPS